MRHVHFIGIGGIGMSALARYYASEGYRVSGSDAVRSSITDALRSEGIKIVIGHRATHVPRTAEIVIYSSAVTPANPELRRAQSLRIPCMTYAEAVGRLTREYYTIAVSGSHGKSTTTALIGLLLVAAGFDPTIIVGTNLKELHGINFRKGKSNYLVLEADEWGKSFHHYVPQIAVVTNVDKEHLDIYKTYQGVIAGFRTYLKRLPKEGIAVLNGKDVGVRRAASAVRGRIIWYNSKPFSRHTLGIPGIHNQENAEAVWQVAKFLGISKSLAEKVFSHYTGAWRRFERLVPKDSRIRATIITDYAHHPTEIRATLRAAREKFPKRRIVCVFEPHQADRLTQLFSEFKSAFRDADTLIVLPVYRVKGREARKGEKTSEDLVKTLTSRNVRFMKTLEEVTGTLGSEFENPQNVFVFMSAGTLDTQLRSWVLKR